MLRIIISLILFFYSAILFSQSSKLDSLEKKLLVTEVDSVRLELLNQLAGENFGVDNEKCKKYSFQLLELSRDLEEYIYEGSALNTLGSLCWYKAKYSEMDSLYQLSLEAHQKAKNNPGIIMAMGNLAISANANRDFNLSISRLEDGIEFAHKVNDSIQTGNLHSNLGKVYKNLGLYQKATEEILKAIKIYDLVDNKKYRGNAYKNLGDVFLGMKNFDKARDYFEQAIEIFEEENYVLGLVNASNSMGVLLSDSYMDYELAIEYFEKSKEYAISSGNVSAVALTNQNIGLQYFFLKKYEEAISYYQKSIDLYKEIGNVNGEMKSEFGLAFSKIPLGRMSYKENLERANEFQKADNSQFLNNDENGYLATAFSEIGAYEKAYAYLFDYTETRDSIFQYDVQNSISSLEGLYQNEKKNKEIAEQNLTIQFREKETQKAKRERNYVALGGIILIVISTLLWIIWLKIKKKNKEISSLYRELHHRSKNNFSVIRVLANANFSKGGKKIRESLTQLNGSIDSLIALHQQMYQKDDLATIDFGDFSDGIFERLKDVFDRKAEMKINSNINPDPNKSSLLGLIINELITNSFKHAQTEEVLKAELKAKKDKGEFILEYSDNGLDKKEMKKGFGLQMIDGLVSQMNGSSDIQKMENKRVQTITIPV